MYQMYLLFEGMRGKMGVDDKMLTNHWRSRKNMKTQGGGAGSLPGSEGGEVRNAALGKGNVCDRR
jgi:hypothetical protein